ncbi:MAG: BrnT family toxin [Verrucomicrobia bacterium]|nr:BrnT family toxin [Verrucomicrobiota bacterium]
MEFEYDPTKSAANLAKHGIDFGQIQKLWDGKVVAAPARDSSEQRLLAIGQLDSKFWTVIITLRNSKIRIISARRSRKNEIKNYKNA